MSSILDVRNLYQNLLNLSLSEELEGQGSTLSCCHSACSSDTALHSSGDSSAVWPLRSHWSPNGEQLRPPLRPDRSVSLIEGKAHLPPPPPGFPPLKQPVPAPSSRYKTELCRTFSESGKCKYGVKCQFAHGSAELRTVSRHPKYKTELCHKFYIHGECPYGSRCHFIHYPEEAQFHSTATTPGASPQLLRQSVSFSGVPTARRTSPLPSLPDSASFARAPSVSPPPASAELLSPAFEHLNVDPLSLMSSLGDSLPAAPSSGCCSCRCGKSAGLASSLQGHRDFFSPAPGTPATPASALLRTSSSNSLSDPECYSSSSSLSGSDSPVFDLHPPGGPAGNPHRLPIFNRLSVSE
ncbi:mRNA decay activator protein ZFP36 [Liasis olivaceus]